MLKNRRMKKSLKPKENLKEFSKTYHGKLLSVIMKEKIERDNLSIKEEFKIWHFKYQRLLIQELEEEDQLYENDIKTQVPEQNYTEIKTITNTLFDASDNEEAKIEQLAFQIYEKLHSSQTIKNEEDLFLSVKKNDFIIKKEEGALQSYTLGYDEKDRRKEKKLSFDKLIMKLINKKSDIRNRLVMFYFIRWKIAGISIQISHLFTKLRHDYFNYINIPFSNKRILNVAIVEDNQRIASQYLDLEI